MSILKDLANVNFKSKKQQNQEKRQNLFLGVLLGTAIGSVAGALMQTDKGKQARKEVVSKAKDLSKKSKVVLINKIKDTKNKVMEKVSSRGEKNYEEDNVMENN